MTMCGIAGILPKPGICSDKVEKYLDQMLQYNIAVAEYEYITSAN